MAKISVVACMRNEALFVLEWVAYQIACGFDQVAVITNNCTDGTDEIIDAVSAHNPIVHHIRNEVPPNQSPQAAGMRLALNHAELKTSEYMLHCDSDEFLHVSCGDGMVQDLLEVTGEADCIALAWRPFGDSGLQQWAGGSVIEQLTYADDRVRGRPNLHKSLFKPNKFKRAIDHMPKDPVEEGVILVNSRGDHIANNSLYHPRLPRFMEMSMSDVTWDNACINHYAIRTRDLFLMKNLRGDGMGRVHQKYQIGSGYWKNYNKNNVAAPEAQRHLPLTLQLCEEFREIAGIREIEDSALAAYFEARRTTLTDEQIARWTL